MQIIEKSAPSNIALIKYWGKHGNQLPNNASLSITLKNALTHMRFLYGKKKHDTQFAYFFDGERNDTFGLRVKTFLDSLNTEMPFLTDYSIEIHSSNTFPHSAGIASSASSMAALALCLSDMEANILDRKLSVDQYLQRSSYIARMGSGSASRSVYPGFVSWGKSSLLPNSSDFYASPFKLKIHQQFLNLADAVLIVSSKPKSVSSTLGHQLMNQHPFSEARYKQAAQNLDELIRALQNGNFEQFASVVENEALTLHSLLMTSSENGLLLKPESIAIIEKIRYARNQLKLNICFTIDAGPNIHLLYPMCDRKEVISFMQNELLQHCEKQNWIDDQME